MPPKKKSTKKVNDVEEGEEPTKKQKLSETKEKKVSSAKKSTQKPIDYSKALKLIQDQQVPEQTFEVPQIPEDLTAQVQALIEKFKDAKPEKKEDYYKIYSTMDLTSLNSTDSPQSITNWVQEKVLDRAEKDSNIKPAAVCVYPNFAGLVSEKVKDLGIKTAAVSTCFPTGQTFGEVKSLETSIAIQEGADEIDMVVSRGFWNEGKADYVLQEIAQQARICQDKAKLKTILEICELKSEQSIYQLSYQALEAGCDFIKTSTGKGTSGSNKEHFIVMCLALKAFNEKNETQRSIKAAGGIKDSVSAWQYVNYVEELLGSCSQDNFRIGTSSLADVVLKDIGNLENGASNKNGQKEEKPVDKPTENY